MQGRISGTRPIEHPLKRIVRAHRIHIEDIPSLFSEGLEPEPALPRRQAWLPGANFARNLRQGLQILLQRFARLVIGPPRQTIRNGRQFNGLEHALLVRVEARSRSRPGAGQR
jgi:hypothetical protein